jgi:hypothetical protein
MFYDMKLLKLHIGIFLILAGNILSGQTQVHVFTRTFAQVFAFSSGDVLKVNALQADVHISGWDKDSVSVTLKLKTKNTDYETAKKDVTNWGYTFNKDGKELILKNYMKKDLLTGSNSIMVAGYEIKVPRECLVHVSDVSGNTTIENFHGALRANTKYGNLEVTNFNGILDINMEVGDFNCFNSIVELNIISKHTEINLEKLTGRIDITSEYGSLRIIESEQIRNIHLMVTRSDIYLIKKSTCEYGLDLNVAYGKINLDKAKYIKEMSKYIIDENPDHTIINYKSAGIIPLIRITNKYGNIFLN